MWRRERASVTHAIIQNVILIVQGDFREELAIIQRNWVRTSSGYRSPQIHAENSEASPMRTGVNSYRGISMELESRIQLFLFSPWDLYDIVPAQPLHSSWIRTLSCAFMWSLCVLTSEICHLLESSQRCISDKSCHVFAFNPCSSLVFW